MSSESELLATIGRLLDRDLQALQQEIAAFPSDEALWLTPPGISNSAGNLAMHIVGNLRHFVGVMLGTSTYTRNREREFATREGTRDSLVRDLALTQHEVMRTLSALDVSRLADPFPMLVMDTQLTTGVFLLHLCTHLSYHLGQVDYHRRITVGDRTTVKTVFIPALSAPWPTSAMA